MSSPCHIELTLSEKEEPVKKEVILYENFFVYVKTFLCSFFIYFSIVLHLYDIIFLIAMILQPETQLAPKKPKARSLRSGASS